MSTTPTSQGTATPVLQVRGLRKTYPTGVTALDGVDLDVAQGEVVAVIGPSGCGKSTLLRSLNGLEEATAGTITFEGVEVPSKELPWQQARQRIGMVFQSYELFPHLNVMDNLLLGPSVVQKADRGEAARRAAELLDRVGLLDRAQAWPRQLSGGQKQRVAIVRALMMRPDVLLLDEVTASLDPEMVREVLEVVADLARGGMTMVLVTHEMAFARAVADRIVFMDHGQVVENTTPTGFFTAPETERARRFLNVVEYTI